MDLRRVSEGYQERERAAFVRTALILKVMGADIDIDAITGAEKRTVINSRESWEQFKERFDNARPNNSES